MANEPGAHINFRKNAPNMKAGHRNSRKKKTLLTQNRQEEVHLPLVAGREGGGEDGRARKTRQIKTVKNNNYRISMFALI